MGESPRSPRYRRSSRLVVNGTNAPFTTSAINVRASSRFWLALYAGGMSSASQFQISRPGVSKGTREVSLGGTNSCTPTKMRCPLWLKEGLEFSVMPQPSGRASGEVSSTRAEDPFHRCRTACLLPLERVSAAVRNRARDPASSNTGSPIHTTVSGRNEASREATP